MNLQVMRAIARILYSDENTAARHPFRVSAPLRLLTAILCILLCALSRNAWFTLSVLAIELLRVSLKKPAEIARILKPVGIAILFAMIFSLPAVFLGSPRSFGTIVMKVAESVLVLSLLNEEVSWKETTGALAAFHLPAVFILTLDQTIRFLVILGRFSNELLEAVSLRHVGRKQWRNAGTGGILGTTFLKSQQLSEQTAEAMRCRGFTGEYKPAGSARRRQKSFSPVHLLYVLLIPCLILGFLYTEHLM